MQKKFKTILPMAEAIERLLHPYAEVVIHDTAKNRIAAIFNPFSKRRVGDASLLTENEMAMMEECVGPYEKINWDGKKLKSVSSLIRNEQGKIIGMLCVNLDISKLTLLNQAMATFLNHTELTTQLEPLFKDDWQEKMNKYIHQYLTDHHLTLTSLTRAEKKLLIEHLQKIGALSGKNAAFYAAQIIGVSRATIYNYLADSE